nr:hypothetical protein [Pyrinomonadaceae bacterium]
MKKHLTQIIAKNQSAPIFKAMPEMNRLQLLENANEAEVLEFLSLRPVHTVVMKSFIKDNGLQSADN